MNNTQNNQKPNTQTIQSNNTYNQYKTHHANNIQRQTQIQCIHTHMYETKSNIIEKPNTHKSIVKQQSKTTQQTQTTIKHNNDNTTNINNINTTTQTNNT